MKPPVGLGLVHPHRASRRCSNPQTGHGGVRRQPCRSRLPAGRSLSSAALSWSDDDVYRLAASPGQLAPSLLPRELHVERVSCGLSRPTSSVAT
eukprot:scaffold45652_cov30-Phaeocystis_antarctica.AAC.2